MKILRSYLLKELLQPTGMAFVLFTFVMLVGNLIRLTDLLINKGVSLMALLTLFGLMVPEMLIYTVPMAVLTGTLLAFGKLSADREITAMKASGIGFFSIALPILAVGSLFSLALVPINHLVVPWSHYARRLVLPEILIRNPAAFLEAGTFIKEFDPYILFIYQVEGNKLSKVRIYEPKEGRPTRTIIAERGEFISLPQERRVLLKLYDGTADEPDPQDPSKFHKLEFKTYTTHLPIGRGQDPSQIGRKPKDMTLDQLRIETVKLSQKGIDSTPLQVEYHRRTAMAFSPLAFILLGLPLGITTRRGQRSIGFALSILIFAGYYLFLILGQTMAQKGILNAAPAMWMANGLFFTAGALLLWQAHQT